MWYYKAKTNFPKSIGLNFIVINNNSPPFWQSEMDCENTNKLLTKRKEQCL